MIIGCYLIDLVKTIANNKVCGTIFFGEFDWIRRCLVRKLKSVEIDSIIKKPIESDFNNIQLDVFQTFLCNNDRERNNLSNTVELWDYICCYSATTFEMNKNRNADGFLPPIEHDFKHNEEQYKVKIHPALIEDSDGITRSYYPSSNEEIIEDVLRHIATNNGQGFYNKEQVISGVVFTIYQVREELKARLKTRSHTEILKSLNILSQSHIEMTFANGKGIAKSNYLSSLASVSKEDYKLDSNAKWVAHFHPLVAKSINNKTYRQINYDVMMMQNSQLARWLYKRLSHCYTNASLDTPYFIFFSTVKNESKLINQKRIRDEIRKLEDAFKELQETKVIVNSARVQEMTEKGNGRGRYSICDVKYKITPHPCFVADTKRSNKRNLLANESLRLQKNIISTN